MGSWEPILRVPEMGWPWENCLCHVWRMPLSSKSKINLADLTPLERKRRIKVKRAKALKQLYA